MRRDGFVLVTVLSMAMLIVAMLVLTSNFALSTRQTVSAEARKIPAFYVANAGLERTLARVAALIQSSYGNKYIGEDPEVVAADIYTQLGTTEGVLEPADCEVEPTKCDLLRSSFVVTAEYVPDTEIIALKSVGTAPNGAQRTIVLKYEILDTRLKVTSNAAMETTGEVVNNGNGSIRGVDGEPDPTKAFTIACTVTAGNTCAYVGSPRVYTVTVPASGEPLPEVDDYIAYNVIASDPKSKILYRVVSVNSATREVELQAVKEDAIITTIGRNGRVSQSTRLTPLSPDVNLAPTTDVASVLTYEGGTDTRGSNTGPTCTVFICDDLTTQPDALFKATFGVSKEEFYNSLPLANRITTDQCATAGNTVQWMTTSLTNFDLASCSPALPRILVIDARGANSSITIRNNNADFQGLLYIIANGAITIQGNSTFGGAVIAETGTDPVNNPGVTITGSSKVRVCHNAQTGVEEQHDAKICYDETVLSGLIDDLLAQSSGLNKPSAEDVAASWAEVRGD